MSLLDTPVGAAATEPAAPVTPVRRKRDDQYWAEFAVTLVIVAACAIFTFVEVQPSNIFSNTTPTGGDMGAHVWLPWFVEHDLLPHFRITGWTMDWYAGFPVLTYYFPLPMLAIIALDVILPYNIAFKIVAVLGLVALPVVAWAFGRLARMPFPGPACLAAATLPFLFSRTFTIYGGNIASSMAGEFSFSLSLAFALLLLGVTARGLETGKHRGLAAILLLCTVMSHVLPTMFAVLGILVLTVMRWDRRRWLWTLPVLVVGGLLSAFWSLAFELRLPYATNMGYQKIVTYTTSLFPAGLEWLYILAGIGAILSIARRRQVGTFLAIMTVLSAIIFRIAPQSRLWNARVLPFWFLCLYLLAGLAFLEVGTLIVEWRRGEGRASWAAMIPVPVITLLVSLIWVGYPLHDLPFGHTTATGKYDWMGITSSDDSFVPGWVTWNLTGYQGADKPRKAEYFALVDLMKQVGNDNGCGRAMWEYQPELNDMGTPDALMLLPYWTNNCIDSMEGLYYESSATTPYHFLNDAELSVSPPDPVRGLTYANSPQSTPIGDTTTNFEQGITHLKMFGVKYYMAISPETQQLAAADPSLRLVASTGNYPVNYTSSDSAGVTGVQQRHWNIYEIEGSTLVTPLQNQPVVMKGVAGGNTAWLNASVDWYDHPNRWSVYEAATGPKSWTRVSATDQNPPQTPLPPVNVSHVKVGQESMSFDVDRTGVPVLVNTSYFPNWEVSGGKGPYRVTPNLMVVIPTSKHVSMTYGYTGLDEFGYAMSFLGLVGLVALWRLGPVRYDDPLAAQLRRRHSRRPAAEGPPPPPAGGGLTEPWARLGDEMADAPAPEARPEANLARWYGEMPGWYDREAPPAPAEGDGHAPAGVPDAPGGPTEAGEGAADSLEAAGVSGAATGDGAVVTDVPDVPADGEGPADGETPEAPVDGEVEAGGEAPVAPATPEATPANPETAPATDEVPGASADDEGTSGSAQKAGGRHPEDPGDTWRLPGILP